MSKKLKIGVCGTGGFSKSFIPLFQRHPGTDSEVVLCDIDKARCQKVAEEFQVKETTNSYDDLLKSDVDAVAIFTPRHNHAELAIKGLKAGKHVYCAVPAAQTLEEMQELVATVEETGLTYMMGETSYYYPATLYCRHRYRAGHMGDFVYGEGEYLHDMAHGFYRAFRANGGDEWRQRAGFPPMFYPTHSTSMLISVTGASLSQVSCLGYQDRHPDGIFKKGANFRDNTFSNESALFRTSDGGMFRVNEFRRVGHGSGNCVRTSMYGTHGCFEQQADSQVWVDINKQMHELNPLLNCEWTKETVELTEGIQSDFHSGEARIQPFERLPKEFAGLRNGHAGSHHFLIDDFVRSMQTGTLPPNHVWNAVRYTAPGIVAHESALKEGESLPIPDFGKPPADATYLEESLLTISEEGRQHIEASAPDLSQIEMGDE